MLLKLGVLEVIVQSSPKLTSYAAGGLVHLTKSSIDGSNPADSLGTVVSFVSQSNQE